MGFLRPVQAVAKPQSFEMATGITFERGVFLWLDTDGKATNVYSASYLPLGLADDDKATSLTQMVQNEELAVSVTLAATGGSTTVATGRTIPSAHQLSSVTYGTATGNVSSWKLELNTAGVYTTIADAGTITAGGLGSGSLSSLTVSLSSAGVVTLAFVGTSLPTSALTLRLTLDYVYTREQSGATLVSDMFSSDSTAASSLVTVWFMDGLYESNQYDPYDTYTVGAALYAKDTGILTTDSTSATQIGNVIKAPSTNWSSETKTTSGHTMPKPEALRFMMRLAAV